tara:strand:+ start:573 stop:767 length:195 start_codon:yes stop_codon:yes gene_type:complete
MVVYLSLVGLLSHNNNLTRYAANLQTVQTPDSVTSTYRFAALNNGKINSDRRGGAKKLSQLFKP